MKKWRKQKDAIGWGTHAVVHRAVPVEGANSSMIAVKSKNMNYAYDLQREAQILRQLRGCAHVIHCFGDDVSRDRHGREDYNLLLEYAPAGSFGRLVYPRCRDNKIMESDVPFYTHQILKGLLYVHDKGFVHCDLKPENILVFPTTREGKFLLKLADFGVSTRAGERDKIFYNDEDDDEDYYDDDEPFCPNHCCGSLVYASPEYLSTGIHHTSDDIWSLGCIVVEMFTGHPPWLCKGTNDLINQILDDKPAIPENISDTAKDFLRKCFYRNDYGDDERWTARMLLNHPFVLNNKDAAFLLESDEDGAMSCPNNPLSHGGDDDDQWVFNKDLFPTFQSS